MGGKGGSKLWIICDPQDRGPPRSWQQPLRWFLLMFSLDHRALVPFHGLFLTCGQVKAAQLLHHMGSLWSFFKVGDTLPCADHFVLTSLIHHAS